VLYIIGLILSGLVVGALGRLAIPGPNPMSIPKTILVGIGGSTLGGLVGYLLFRNGGGLILSVLGAALIVWLLERRQQSAGGFDRRSGFGSRGSGFEPRGPQEPYRQ
jgi:uncharacterized membrane protein YeaQ/YmgE (transglycosylase-associated protein family)